MGLLDWIMSLFVDDIESSKKDAVDEINSINLLNNKLNNYDGKFILERTEFEEDIAHLKLILSISRDLLRKISEKGVVYSKDDVALFGRYGKLATLEEKIDQLRLLIISKRRIGTKQKLSSKIILNNQFRDLKLLKDSKHVLDHLYTTVSDMRKRGILIAHDSTIKLNSGVKVHVSGLTGDYVNYLNKLTDAYLSTKFIDRVKAIKTASDKDKLTLLGVTDN